MLLLHLKSEKLVIILDGKSSEHGFLKKLLFFFLDLKFLSAPYLCRGTIGGWEISFPISPFYLFIIFFSGRGPSCGGGKKCACGCRLRRLVKAAAAKDLFLNLPPPPPQTVP